MLARILYYYYKTIYLKRVLTTKEKLINYQQKQFKKLMSNTLIYSPFYQEFLNKPLLEWPVVNKQIMNQSFDEINTVGINYSKALNLALQAEETRDFSPLIDNIAVGLSSGTSGQRGLFLTSPKERDAWVGIMLAKILPNGFKSRESIAFFLRANNPLYTAVNKSKKIQLHFFDLLQFFDEHIHRLNLINPTILSAPSSVLRLLAAHRNRLKINPKKIIAVAEVLEKSDEAFISNAFGLPVSQVYQCTEGFLAASDKKSNHLVLNEEFLIIEKEWIDKDRFVPIITDLMRTTQPIIRHRLDDVLIVKNTGTVFTELEAVEGRLGDVCYGKKGNELIPLFADTLRQHMASSPIVFEDYLICQTNVTQFSIQIMPETIDKEGLIRHLNRLFESKGCETPFWLWQPYEKKERAVKMRRIQSRVFDMSIP